MDPENIPSTTERAASSSVSLSKFDPNEGRFMLLKRLHVTKALMGYGIFQGAIYTIIFICICISFILEPKHAVGAEEEPNPPAEAVENTTHAYKWDEDINALRETHIVTGFAKDLIYYVIAIFAVGCLLMGLHKERRLMLAPHALLNGVVIIASATILFFLITHEIGYFKQFHAIFFLWLLLLTLIGTFHACGIYLDYICCVFFDKKRTALKMDMAVVYTANNMNRRTEANKTEEPAQQQTTT